MVANPNISMTKPSQDNPDPFVALRIRDPAKLLRRVLIKSPVNLGDRLPRKCLSCRCTTIDPGLYRGMRFGFELEVALLRVGAV